MTDWLRGLAKSREISDVLYFYYQKDCNQQTCFHKIMWSLDHVVLQLWFSLQTWSYSKVHSFKATLWSHEPKIPFVPNIEPFLTYITLQFLKNLMLSEFDLSFWSAVVKFWKLIPSQPYAGWIKMTTFNPRNFLSPWNNIFLTVPENKFVWNYCFSGPTTIYLFNFSNSNSK